MLKIKTSNTVLKEIETLVITKGVSYIDAALLYCEKNNIEPDMVGDIIKTSSVFKQRVQAEAEDLNFLPKSVRLPL